jgi:DNA-directed RNA polymerase subunit N
MMINVRCWSCGKPIAHLWEEFNEKTLAGKSKKEVMDELGLERYCCRSSIMGNIDLVDIAGKFKKY